jgi:hypothetical protein
MMPVGPTIGTPKLNLHHLDVDLPRIRALNKR